MYVRQSIVATTVTIRESLVIESHQMKNGRVQIMDMHTVLHSRQTKLIRCSVTDPAFHAAASHPRGEAVVIVITSLLAF